LASSSRLPTESRIDRIDDGVIIASPIRSRSRPATGASSTGGRPSGKPPSCSELTQRTSGNNRMICRKLRKMPTAAVKKIRLLMNGLDQKNSMIRGAMMAPTSAMMIRKMTILIR
jgi:hypothetical protein